MSACPRIPTKRYRAVHDSIAICPGCRTELPRLAMFCVECGLCMLDVTSEGTVIAAAPTGPEGDGRPMQIVEDDTSEAIQLDPEDMEIDIDALVAEIMEEAIPTEPLPEADTNMTRRFERVSAVSAVSTTRSSALSDTVADEIEVDLSDNEIELFFEDISSPIHLGRGPLTSFSDWPAPDVGATLVGPPPARPRH